MIKISAESSPMRPKVIATWRAVKSVRTQSIDVRAICSQLATIEIFGQFFRETKKVTAQVMYAAAIKRPLAVM